MYTTERTVGGIGGQVGHHTALGGDAHVVADLQVLRDAHLAAHVHVAAERRAAGDPRLRRDHAANAELHVVADLDLQEEASKRVTMAQEGAMRSDELF